MYVVEGENIKAKRKFSIEIEAKSKEIAKEHVLSALGSRHRVKREDIRIDKVEVAK